MSKARIRMKALTCAAMFVAMNVIIGIFCKTFMNFGLGLFRVTFENLPIILSGILLGPVVGGIVGAVGDIISYLLSSQVYPPNLIVTFGAMAVGVVSGIVSNYIVKRDGVKRIVITSLSAHLVGSVIIKSIGLYTFYGMLVLWRIPLYFVIASLETLLICILHKNPNFKKTVEAFKGLGR